MGPPLLVVAVEDLAFLRDDRDPATRLELDHAVAQREQGVVLADAHAFAGVEARAALAHQDVAGDHVLTPVLLDAAHLRVGITTVLGRTTTFLMCHRSVALLGERL